VETKANYIAVGAFVLACVVGLVVVLLWLAGAQYSQEYAYYQTSFKGPVTGLGKGTVTRYDGIDVGRVTDLEFDPKDPQYVIATLQVRPGLNIREDSVASIESQGLTGGSYVEISGGTANSPMLTAKEGQQYPMIRSKPSTLQLLEQSAPEVVAKMNVAASRINDLLNDKNRAAISSILSNLNETTTMFARRSGDIDAAIRNTNALTASLNDASRSLKPALVDTDVTVKKFGVLATDADTFVNSDGVAQLSDLIADMRRLVVSLTKLSNGLSQQPTKLIFGDRRKGYAPK
jgi:phospholipid/cholesterol/gamma-HCH transport system substrate-binding protein